MTRAPQTVAGLAEAMGLSRQSLYTWASEGCPVHSGQQAILDWHAQHKRATARNQHMRASKIMAPGKVEHPCSQVWRASSQLTEALDSLQVSPAKLDDELKRVMYMLWIRLSLNRHHMHIDESLTDDEVEQQNHEIQLQFDQWFWAGIDQDESPRME